MAVSAACLRCLGFCLIFNFLVCDTGDPSKPYCILGNCAGVVVVVVVSVLASGICEDHLNGPCIGLRSMVLNVCLGSYVNESFTSILGV